MTDRIRLEVDGIVLVEGVHFSVDRAAGAVTMLLDCELGPKGSVHRFAEPVKFEVEKRESMKKVAQWKSR